MRTGFLLLVMTLLLAACALPIPVLTTGAPATETEEPAVGATAEATAEAATEAATVNLDETLDGIPILVDSEGFPFYTFTGTEEPADLIGFRRAEAGEADTAGAGLDEAQLGSLEREGGFNQLTYAGRPLYQYTGTLEAGTAGASDGEFAFVGPEGELVGEGVGEDPGAIEGGEAITETQEITPTQEMTPTAEMTDTAGLAAGMATVSIADTEELGEILTDAEGRSLYLFLSDEGAEGSTCYDQCAENWPPLTVEEMSSAGEGVDADLLGTIERDDGSLQVTYNDWPLYYYAGDEEPGDTVGQGRGDVWYVVSPEGEAIQE